MKRFICIVRCIEHTRSNKDRRRFVDYYICEYHDDNNTEYRKGFEVACGETFVAPKTI